MLLQEFPKFKLIGKRRRLFSYRTAAEKVSPAFDGLFWHCLSVLGIYS